LVPGPVKLPPKTKINHKARDSSRHSDDEDKPEQIAHFRNKSVIR
jgi:hypothetical protein